MHWLNGVPAGQWASTFRLRPCSGSGQGGSGSAVIYVDGITENPKIYGTASNSTLVVNYDQGLDRGRHTVVVFGNVGRQASAFAWSFTVKPA